jgi:hypothetical protein
VARKTVPPPAENPDDRAPEHPERDLASPANDAPADDSPDVDAPADAQPEPDQPDPVDAGANQEADPEADEPDDMQMPAEQQVTEATGPAPDHAPNAEAMADLEEAGQEVPDTTDTATDEAPEAPPTHTAAPRPAPPPARGAGVVTMLTGGILAAVIGFGAARFVIPEGWPFGPVSQATRDLTAALNDQAARLDALSGRVDANGQTAAAARDTARAAQNDGAEVAAQLTARIDEIDARLAPLQEAAARIDTFDQRLTALERQPSGDGSASKAAIESFQRELDDLRQMLEAERARNAAAEAEAEARAKAVAERAEALSKQAARDAAFAQLSQVLASGGSLTGAVAALKGAGVAVPDALDAHAAEGVATLESLQKGFAEPARAALAAAADQVGTGQIGAFLRAWFGVRSLTPRAGDSPDAILSRAEAAVGAGDLAGAIAELNTLPPAAHAAMADWIKAATARHAVVEAAATMAPQ